MRRVSQIGEFEFIDIAYRRYSDPMPLLDAMAASGRLSWFVKNLINVHIEEENEKTLWELWLHRVYDKSFNDFKNEMVEKGRVSISAEATRNNPKKAARIVSKSMSILEGFKPEN